MWILNGSKACRRFTDKTWHDQLTERDNLAGVESPWRHCRYVQRRRKSIPRIGSSLVNRCEMVALDAGCTNDSAVSNRIMCSRSFTRRNYLPDVTDLCPDFVLWLVGLRPRFSEISFPRVTSSEDPAVSVQTRIRQRDFHSRSIHARNFSLQRCVKPTQSPQGDGRALVGCFTSLVHSSLRALEFCD
jgi:hypothetical protein